MTADELRALAKKDQEQERRLKEAQEEAIRTRADLKLARKDKKLKNEIAVLQSKIPDPKPDTKRQPADSKGLPSDGKGEPRADGRAKPSAGRPLSEAEILLAQKMAEAKALDDSISRIQAKSGARKQDVEDILQARTELQSDIRALKAGLEPSKQEATQDGPRITLDQVQLVERPSSSPRATSSPRRCESRRRHEAGSSWPVSRATPA